MNKTVLVLGVTGGIGAAVAQEFLLQGWTVRVLLRNGSRQDLDSQYEQIQGDVMSAPDVLRAAQGCAVIVHGVNPKGYRDWSALVLPMLQSTLDAAAAVSATILMPGTIYNYGQDAFPLLSEDSAQNPATDKGKIRVALENELKQFASLGGRVILLRAGDFFGPKLGNSWFSQGLVQAGKPVKSVAVPTEKFVGHTWAYLPDVARTMVLLAQKQNELDNYADFHMKGHWDATGRELAESIQRVVEQDTGRVVRIKSFPWLLLVLLRAFVPIFRELLEMRVFWQHPLQLDNSKLLAVLGQEPHTPLQQAVRTSLQGIACLPQK